MQLAMYLGNDFIAAIRVNKQQISQPGYMGNLKKQLLNENSTMLLQATHEPEFLLVRFSHPCGEIDSGRPLAG